MSRAEVRMRGHEFVELPKLEVGFTGTQVGLGRRQQAALSNFLYRLSREWLVTLHHGDCIGADREAHLLALGLGMRIVVHPPSVPDKRAWCEGDEILPEDDYLRRNKKIVHASDLLVACPHQAEEKLRSGTWSTYRYAKRIERPRFLIFPAGLVLREPRGYKIRKEQS